MKTLKLIAFENGKEAVVHTATFAPEHPMFKNNSWPEVILYHTEYYALLEYDDNAATYSITSGFNLE